MKKEKWRAPVKKGVIEHTMDKAMIITFGVVVSIILVVAIFSAVLYKNSMDAMWGNNGTEFLIPYNINEKINSRGEFIIPEDVYYTADDGNKYVNTFKLGLAVLDTKLISIGGLEESNNIFKYTNIIWMISGILFIYWLVLLWNFEKEKKYNQIRPLEISDEEIFKRMNPLIARML